ncbi:hypothetical protein F2Q68_00013014 [Brassica cretica]|nr:hypothetical protein F2Q68_00013014 [Brassica cretica]
MASLVESGWQKGKAFSPSTRFRFTLSSLFSFALSGPPLYLLCVIVSMGSCREPWECEAVFLSRPGITRKEVSAQILFYFIIEDFVFYWGHRILHTKWLYKTVHSVHHEYATPFGLTSEYAHPAEILFLGFATIVGPALTGPHLITLWLWMVLRVLETVEAHCGYHFPWSLSNFLPLYGGADFHDYHHRLLYTKSGNYSSTFVYMDWIFGTDKGYRRLKYLKENSDLKQTEGLIPQPRFLLLFYFHAACCLLLAAAAVSAS